MSNKIFKNIGNNKFLLTEAISTDVKIKNEKHYAILGQDFTAKTITGPKTYKKGFRVPTDDLYSNNGYYVIEGHGLGHIIPRDLFTKFTRTWDEVTTTKEDGNKVIKITQKKEDETEDILNWWAQLDARRGKRKPITPVEPEEPEEP